MNEATVCNKCGRKLDFWDIQEDFSIIRSLGYGTKYDGDELDIHLCCDCMDCIIDDCKVSPVYNVLFGKVNDSAKGGD